MGIQVEGSLERDAAGIEGVRNGEGIRLGGLRERRELAQQGIGRLSAAVHVSTGLNLDHSVGGTALKSTLLKNPSLNVV